MREFLITAQIVLNHLTSSRFPWQRCIDASRSARCSHFDTRRSFEFATEGALAELMVAKLAPNGRGRTATQELMMNKATPSVIVPGAPRLSSPENDL